MSMSMSTSTSTHGKIRRKNKPLPAALAASPYLSGGPLRTDHHPTHPHGHPYGGGGESTSSVSPVRRRPRGLHKDKDFLGGGGEKDDVDVFPSTLTSTSTTTTRTKTKTERPLSASSSGVMGGLQSSFSSCGGGYGTGTGTVSPSPYYASDNVSCGGSSVRSYGTHRAGESSSWSRKRGVGGDPPRTLFLPWEIDRLVSEDAGHAHGHAHGATATADHSPRQPKNKPRSRPRPRPRHDGKDDNDDDSIRSDAARSLHDDEVWDASTLWLVGGKDNDNVDEANERKYMARIHRVLLETNQNESPEEDHNDESSSLKLPPLEGPTDQKENNGTHRQSKPK